MRGKSLDEAAGLAGISKSYLSRLERGERSVDSRALLARLAQVLDASVTDITGQPYTPRDPEHAAAHEGVASLRMALLDPYRPSPLDEIITDSNEADLILEASAYGLWELARDSNFREQSRLFPALLSSAQKVMLERPSAAALRAVALGAYNGCFFARNLGEPDLSWIAAKKMREACELLGDPTWLAFSSYTEAHALTQVGALRRASEVAIQSAESTPVDRSRVDQITARGSCLLVGAFSAACVGDVDSARAALAEAEELARISESHSFVSDNTTFGYQNVVMHQVAVEVEAGDAVAALRAADRLDPRTVSNKERLSYFWVDVGRSWARLDKPREALAAFRRAELAAPLRVHLSPIVRENVRNLLDLTVRRSTGTQLRGLAERCGVLGKF